MTATPSRSRAGAGHPWTERRGARPGLALLSGLLLFLSFPKFGHAAFAWVALAPLLLAVPGLSPWRAACLGQLCGLVAYSGLLYWTALTVARFGGLPMALAVPLMLLLSAAVALFPMLFAGLVARYVLRFGPAGLWLAPFAWVATETLRTYTFFRFPWCLLGYSQYEHPIVLQIAALGAVYAVSFVLVAASAACAYVLVEPCAAARRRAPAGLALLLGATLAFGAWRLDQPIPEAGRLRVGLVQASIRQEDKWRPGLYEDNVRRHVRLTLEAAAAGARLVVWPESAVPWPYDLKPAVAADLQELARSRHVALLFGNDDRDERSDPPRIFVGAKLLTPDGRLGLRYHKLRLVPFGEYVPFKALLTLGGRQTARLVQQAGEFTPGSEYALGELDGRRFASLICYEVIFPELSREFVRRGADLLVSLTNDGWYGTSSAPHQHLMMAVLRAVEEGKALVRAANTGVSAVIDPRGRILERSALFEERVLVRDVPIVPGGTPYTRWGDRFAFACLGLTVLAALLPARVRIRAPEVSP